MPKEAQLAKGRNRTRTSDFHTLLVCYYSLERAAQASQKSSQVTRYWAWMDWDQSRDKRASEGNARLPPRPGFVVTDMGGTFPKARVQRTSCDSQPLLPCLNPFLPFGPLLKLRLQPRTLFSVLVGPPGVILGDQLTYVSTLCHQTGNSLKSLDDCNSHPYALIKSSNLKP